MMVRGKLWVHSIEAHAWGSCGIILLDHSVGVISVIGLMSWRIISLRRGHVHELGQKGRSY